MGFFNNLVKLAKPLVEDIINDAISSDTGFAGLKNASDSELSSNKPGVYLLIIDGDIKKVGSTEIGVQKRMQQYYGLNKSCGLNHRINSSNRDRIKVKWQYCNTGALS